MMWKKIIRSFNTVFKRIWKDIKNFCLVIVALAVYNIISRKLFHAFCPQLIFTGFPCAGCGMTRAVFYIMTGQFCRGIALNPAAPLWIIFLSWFFWNRYVRGIYSKKTNVWLGLVCVVTFAIYVYRMLNCFPGSPPMVYYRNNILSRIVKYYMKGLHNFYGAVIIYIS